MNPTQKLNLITEIALELQRKYNTSGINILLSGYGIQIKDVSSVYSKRQYAIDLLNSQSNETVFKIANDLNLTSDSVLDICIDKLENNTLDMKKKIFISHSSKDIDIVEKLIDILEAIGVPSENIFCSSFEGYGVQLGLDFLETIKTELNSNVLVLFVLSKNFYSSVVSLCEMGATWVKTNEHIPILIPPFEYSEIKGVIPTTHGMKVNEKAKFNLLKEKVEIFMNLPQSNFSAWERKRDKILKEIQSLLDKNVKTLEKESVHKQTISNSTDQSDFDNALEIIKKQSKEEWPDDFEMQLDHIQRQKEAVKKLKQNTPTDIPSTVFDKIRKDSQKEWPNDYEMQLDHEQRQINSYRKLNNCRVGKGESHP